MGQNNCESDSQTKTDEDKIEEKKEGFTNPKKKRKKGG